MEKTNDDAIAKFHQRKRRIRKIVLFLIAFIFIAIALDKIKIKDRI